MRPPPPWRLLAAVAAGGAVGALLRWALGVGLPDGAGFPATTFAINLIGSFALASLPAVEAVRRSRLLTVGLGPGSAGWLHHPVGDLGAVARAARRRPRGAGGVVPPGAPSAPAWPASRWPTAGRARWPSRSSRTRRATNDSAAGRAGRRRRRPSAVPRRSLARRPLPVGHAAGQRGRARSCSGSSRALSLGEHPWPCWASASAAASRRTPRSR